MSMSYTQQVNLGQQALLDQCLREGVKKERAPGIYQYYLQHSGGILYLYTNETSDKMLKEEMGFKLEGLEIEGQDDQSKVEIELGPGEEKVISIKATGGGWKFGTSCSYGIASV